MRPIGRADIERSGTVLARAFADDPFMLWLTDGDTATTLPPLCHALVKMYRPKGHSYTTGDGVALWSPPGKWKLSTWQQVRYLPTFIRAMGMDAMRRGGVADGVMAANHPDEPHWYLSMLGVDPDRQRSGVGRSLLEPMLERADQGGDAAYLETAKADNVPYYQGFGFEVRSEATLPRGGPQVWFMLRHPH